MKKTKKEICRVMKYEIKPVDYTTEEWDILYSRILKETNYLLNKTTCLCWEYENLASQYIKNVSYDKNRMNEILDYTDLQGFCYDKLKNESIMYSSNLSATIKLGADKWNNDIEDIRNGLKSPSVFNKKDFPIEVAGNTIEIYNENNKYYSNIKMINLNYKKERNKESTSVLFEMIVKDNTQKVILHRILDGTYKVAGSKMQIRKKRNKAWYDLILTYKFEVDSVKELDKSNILGIDLGVKKACVGAFNNSLDRFFIDGSEISEFKRKTESRKVALQRQSKYCGKGRLNRGYKTRMKPLENVNNKISNFRDTTNHKYAKHIVNQALKHGCGVIQMEDLSGIKKSDKNSKFLDSWSYDDLQRKIKNKAEKYNIEVRKVSPLYTSQMCSCCGYIHKENRKNQSNFMCINCGAKRNADYNASLNIAQENIKVKIKIQSYIQDLFKENYIDKFPMKKIMDVEGGVELYNAVEKFLKLHYDLKSVQNKEKINKINDRILRQTEIIDKIYENMK
ncbi:hypothetical protein GCM10008908_09450 [Clostridium subterminale]|uniref:Cas12f1-like TNB domain-containing protein n=1 Tax=Clostridium subterminale TaxID=1550 RepID=A0ABN1KJU4_CLOSU